MKVFQEMNYLDKEYLVGWEEIRAALRDVEKLRQSGKNAKVEIINSINTNTLRITLRSIKELDEYLNSHLRRLILDGAKEDTSSVSGRINFS